MLRLLQDGTGAAQLHAQVSLSGAYSVTADADGLVGVWDVRASAANVCRLHLGARPSALYFAGIAEPLLSATWQDCALSAWDLRLVRLSLARVTRCCGQALNAFSNSDFGQVRRPAAVLAGHGDVITQARLIGSGWSATAVTGSADWTLAAFSLQLSCLTASLALHSAPVTGMLVLPAADTSAAAWDCWSISRAGHLSRCTSALQDPLHVDTGQGSLMSLHAYGDDVVTVSADGATAHWDASTGERVHVAELRQSVTVTAADASAVYAGSADGTVSVWRFTEGL